MSALQRARDKYKRSKIVDSPAANTRKVLSQAKMMSKSDRLDDSNLGPEERLRRMRENLLNIQPPRDTSISDNDEDFEASQIVPSDQTKLIRLDIKRLDKMVTKHVDDVRLGLVAYAEELVDARYQDCQMMTGELDEKIDLKTKEANKEVQKIKEENKALRERIDALELLTDEVKVKEWIKKAVDEAVGKAKKDFKPPEPSKQMAPRTKREIQKDNHERAKADLEVVIRNAKNDMSNDIEQAKQYLKKVATVQVDGQYFSRTWITYAQWKGKSEPSKRTVLVAKFEDKRIRDQVLKMIPKEKKDGKNGNLFIRPGICASDRRLHNQIYKEFDELKAQGKIKPDVEKPKIRGSNGYLYLCPSVKIGKTSQDDGGDDDEVGALANNLNKTLNLNKPSTSKDATT